MSQYFYIFLDFALVFGGLVLLLIGAIYAGFYLVVRWAGQRFVNSVDKKFEFERKHYWRPRRDAQRQVKND